MGRKNSFLPDAMKKDKVFQKLKHKDLISWREDHGGGMVELIESIRATPIPQELIKKSDLSIDMFKDHLLVGTIEINKKLKLFVEREYHDLIYLVTDNEYKELYLLIEKCAPIFWYHYINRKDFLDQIDQIVETYDKDNYDYDFKNKVRAFIGTEQMLGLSFEELENFFIIGSHTEILTWGSYWKDHPFREIYMTRKVNKNEGSQLSREAMKHRDPNIKKTSIRTAFSKSLITLENYDDIFVVEISYDPITCTNLGKINTIFDREYPLDLPIDVVISIINFPFVTHLGMLRLIPVTKYNFIVASLIAQDLETRGEMIDEMKKIIGDLETLKESSKDEKENLEEDEKLEISKHFLQELEKNTYLEHLLMDESVEKFIGEKLINLRLRDQNFSQVKEELFDLLDKKLTHLKARNDPQLKGDIVHIIGGILKFGL